MSDLECRKCGGGGMLTVPDGDGESASEQACPDPVHDGTVTAQTAGQAACEAFWGAVRRENGDGDAGDWPGNAWDWAHDRNSRDAWHEAAQAVLAAQEPHAAPGDDEMARALAVVAAERNQYRIALERIADGSRNRDGMMGCASRALTEAARSEPSRHAGPSPS